MRGDEGRYDVVDGNDPVRAAVVAERREQAELLATLDREQWDAPTLCVGWRVREVVAHVTMPFRMSLPRTVAELVRSGGRFDRMADRCARRDAARMSPEQLVAVRRDTATHPWTPPGGGVAGALAHDVIHGLDITVGLGVDRRVPPERLALVLTGMRPRNIAYFGVDLTGVRLRATDVDWSLGDGTPLTGLAQDLLLVVCGRRLPPGRLTGGAAARFTAGG
ncbi:maleylpyruvate isomerase family mycothiol-dependent enzyme [Micromonospora sp. R77]|uniref:maleylpyruvate isomerase family mycothiol-dependent enzyme n=1 Tax=Micromonospora sp. R77 TaxID=2925836 RepID=UPI001F622B6D|nr:maleylpyruvate isomerase family mycothiol-dependent enzyme [Micromonospora sp. R77]MCI4066622.1 maleylpyruvate isomerase family mycothiol-dependent enzyme [Micromonospora sp. R77]